MTHEEVLAMVPGRELDRLIQTKVFGHQLEGFEWAGDTSHSLTKVVGNVIVPHNIPAYSTEISAAWEVVEKMQEKWMVSIYANPGFIPGELYTVHVSKTAMGRNLTEVDTATAPEAICKSALLSLIKEETP